MDFPGATESSAFGAKPAPPIPGTPPPQQQPHTNRRTCTSSVVPSPAPVGDLEPLSPLPSTGASFSAEGRGLSTPIPVAAAAASAAVKAPAATEGAASASAVWGTEAASTAPAASAAAAAATATGSDTLSGMGNVLGLASASSRVVEASAGEAGVGEASPLLEEQRKKKRKWEEAGNSKQAGVGADYSRNGKAKQKEHETRSSSPVLETPQTALIQGAQIKVVAAFIAKRCLP